MRHILQNFMSISGSTAYVYPLDIQNGSAAFGLTLLRSAYAGNCLRIRRSSDNTTQDIGFVGHAVDVASMLSFCGGGNGFLNIWYDQTGNGLDVSQSALASQPEIISSGALSCTINSLIALHFASHFLDGTTATSYCGNSEFTVFIVFDAHTITNTFTGSNFFKDDALWGDTGGWINGSLRTSSPNFQSGCNNDCAFQSVSLDTNYVGVAQHTGGNCKTYLNSQTSGASQAVTDSSMTTSTMRVGGGFTGTGTLVADAKIAAVLFYDASVSPTNLNAVGSALASYYGIGWS